MTLKVLPPGLAQRLLEGEEDILSEMSQEQTDHITSKPCPRCSGAMQEHFEPEYVFSSDDPLPHSVAKCVDCDHTFDPRSGIVIETGNPAKVEEVIPEIGKKDPEIK